VRGFGNLTEEELRQLADYFRHAGTPGTIETLHAVDVPDDAISSREETFGPVASIEIVDDANQEVDRANATGYGLSAGIITGDNQRGFELAQRIDSGIVHVNDQTVGDEPQMPFGGVKDSGWGRFGGRAAVEEFTELRWVTIQAGARHFPF
jgi:acyl-CoA reductase-like NAD-dependent aldehyde dehydrogenase